ncbi:MAG TPA: aldo/keto reductase [Pseudonocardiaceae bacterium]|nr:aldo/keto reductase [Pseudonocardiaceae bacterium]
MKTRTLGTTGLEVSAIGFGCMGLSQGYGPADDAESLATLHRAIDLGITLLDTAMSYGAGHNEELVGRAIAGRRDRVVLATKFGIVRGPDGVSLDGRPEHVRGHLEASLRRLGVDYVDLYYLHRVDPEVPVEDTVGAMAELVAEGKVRFLGLSEVDGKTLERAGTAHPISAVQSEWSLLWREIEDDVVPAARRLGVGLVPYSPLGRGLLTGTLTSQQFAGGSVPAGDFRAGDPRFEGEHLRQNLAVVDVIRQIATDNGLAPGQLALAWLLAQGADVVPVPGTRRAARVADNVAAAELELPAGVRERLDTVAARSAWAGDRRSFAAHGTTRSG